MIPADIEKRNKLNKYAEEVVTFKKEQDVLKEDEKNVYSIVKEEFDGDTLKSFKAIVKARYNQQKLEKQIEENKTAIAENEILKGK